MRRSYDSKTYNLDEYIRGEWVSELRHEFIDGRLFAMPHEDCLNNSVRGNLASVLYNSLRKAGYRLFIHDIKVAIPNENKYYYPDVFATREEANEHNEYIQYAPEIIVEVVSESTHSTDYIDKYIDYTKIPSLQYYLIVEPETTLITIFERDGDNWVTHKYTQRDAVVKLPSFNIEFLVKQVYE